MLSYILHYFVDLIAIGDIESFFNENFFKKVPVQERKIDHRHSAASDVTRFNGSPETHYEPFYNTYIPYKSTRSRQPEDEVKSIKPTFSNRPNHFNRDIPLSKPNFPKTYDFDLGEEKSVPHKAPITTAKPTFQRQYDFKIGEEKTISSKPTFPKHKNSFDFDKEMNDFQSPKLDGMPKFPQKNVLDEHSNQVNKVKMVSLNH